ncbi:MAG: T9SS type A sorting domain-containing protein, partial [Saprospiraceae bacterium]|nr:T9SS type A sorting domain-containing protein [Saprospiraceae bacterium]
SNYPFTEEQIMGRDRMKRVFSYVPANAAPQGVCWLWHGTNGSASSWAGSEYEQFQFARYLVLKGWGVIITESDESTVGMDLNGDAAIRYDYFPDSVQSVDIANVRAIRDTFINRGKMSWGTPQAALGFSAGGAFSTLLAGVLHWQAAVTHCNPGVNLAVQNTTVPFLFSMNARDNHPDVGVAGAMQAYENWEFLSEKGICAGFDLLRPSPTYPERFKRLPGINSSLSYAINNELVSNGCFGLGAYMIKSPAQIEMEVINTPSNWPVIVGLTTQQQQFVKDQLDVMWSAHHFHSDFMGRDFKFISNPCSMTIGAQEVQAFPDLAMYPNPATDWVVLPHGVKEVRVLDVDGRVVLHSFLDGANRLNVSSLPKGFYFLLTNLGTGRLLRQ